jgi:hypothetical protein
MTGLDTLTLTSDSTPGNAASVVFPYGPVWVITDIEAQLVTIPWTLNQLANQPSVTRAAAAGVQHAITDIYMRAQSGVALENLVSLSDGGALFDQSILYSPAGGVDETSLSGSPLAIGAADAAVTLAFEAPVSAGNNGVVAMSGYSTTDINGPQIQFGYPEGPGGFVLLANLGRLDQPGHAEYSYTGALRANNAAPLIRFGVPPATGQVQHLEVQATAI